MSSRLSLWRSLTSLLLVFVLLGLGFAAGKSGYFPGIFKALLAEYVPVHVQEYAPFDFLADVVPSDPEGGFAFYAPGDLVGRSGTGPARDGARDWTLYAPDMAFPVGPSNPAYLNSQIHSPGGGAWRGDGPNHQCVRANYTPPWRDNFCERRSGKDRESLGCASRSIHQGVDIRGGTGGARDSICARMAWDKETRLVPVVAAEDGFIEYSLLPHKYVTRLITENARVYSYLHLERRSLEYAPGARVKKGDIIGYLSNEFGRSVTTHHLHFEILQNMRARETAENPGIGGWSHVPPYLSLVRAYERDRGVVGTLVEDAQ